MTKQFFVGGGDVVERSLQKACLLKGLKKHVDKDVDMQMRQQLKERVKRRW